MIFEVGSMKGLFFIGILKILEGDIAILGRGKIEMLGKVHLLYVTVIHKERLVYPQKLLPPLWKIFLNSVEPAVKTLLGAICHEYMHYPVAALEIHDVPDRNFPDLLVEGEAVVGFRFSYPGTGVAEVFPELRPVHGLWEEPERLHLEELL